MKCGVINYYKWKWRRKISVEEECGKEQRFEINKRYDGQGRGREGSLS